MGILWVSISPQLGHLPAAGGGPWCPRTWEEPLSEPVGRGGTEGGGEVEVRQDQCSWGQGDQERQVGGALWEEQEGVEGDCPTHSSPGSLLGSQVRSPDLWDQGLGAGLGPFCFLSLSPTPHSPRSLFQPCGSWALALPTAQTSPLLRSRPPQPRPHHPPRFFFLFPPPLSYYCGTVVPSGCCFIYIFIFIFYLTCLLVS